MSWRDRGQGQGESRPSNEKTPHAHHPRHTKKHRRSKHEHVAEHKSAIREAKMRRHRDQP